MAQTVALMVAEKPSLALSLAKILSGGAGLSSRKGSNGACSVHEWSGRFRGENVHFKMTSVCGHVMTCDFPPKYNNWDKVDPVELFLAETLKKEATEKLHMPQFLAKEGRGADYLILWLDCDKEGENICFEVIDCIKPVMRKRTGQTIFRAKFSAITDRDIKDAMTKLVAPNKDESLSVDARQELDLRVGCAFTRFQTKFFQGKYGNLDSTVISYGPCQTPTLGFCVARHDEIQSFKPESYWVLQPQVTHNKSNMSMKLDWERVRMFDKDIAQMFHSNISGVKEAKVSLVSKKEKVKQRPQALNTVEMLRQASSGLGMGPQYTMQVAERLYTQGYISYPRTETNSYPENFDLRGTLKMFVNNSEFKDCAELIRDGFQKPRKGHDAGDHPPITPMRSATEAELGHENFRLYNFIVRYFIGTITPDCKYLQTTGYLEIGKEKFSCTGKTLISPGFTTAMTWQGLVEDERLPEMEKGDICRVDEVKLVEKQTSPPEYLTESELISLMEKHSIGTDASIPVHINNICERNYVQVVGSSRKLQPTPLGIVLVHGYQKIDPELVLPTMRAATEKLLNLIAQGKEDFRAVLQHVVKTFEMKYKYFVKNITGMDELFEVSFSPLASTGKPLSRCGQCNRYMKFVDVKPMRLHCAVCNVTYKLPQNGHIKLYQELKCPLDNFELVMWTTGAKGKSYPLCPYCYTNPPFGDMRPGFSCLECSHPTCKHALSQNGVSCCVECEDGLMMIDRTSAPKWKLVCNKCNVVINFKDEAHIHRLDLSEEQCGQCEATYLHVTFHKDKTPLADGVTEYTGCLFCDQTLKQYVALHHAQMRIKTSSSRGRGRGRGRGKGRRGRGGRGSRGT